MKDFFSVKDILKHCKKNCNILVNAIQSTSNINGISCETVSTAVCYWTNCRGQVSKRDFFLGGSY